MIGLFDSGDGGLTILAALAERFPSDSFVYLGDHANVPYGDRASAEIVALTQAGVEELFERGARLVILACNTATAIACRSLQQTWLPDSKWAQHNVLGIVAPTVEVATQTPWAVTEPRYPQKFNTGSVAVFGTTRTIDSGVYPEEILKRCPQMEIAQQACPGLADAIEHGASQADLDRRVAAFAGELLDRTGEAPHSAILGCTHYSIIERLFRRHLPESTRILSQPGVVADSLEDYLERHPGWKGDDPPRGDVKADRIRLYSTRAESERPHGALHPSLPASLRACPITPI